MTEAERAELHLNVCRGYAESCFEEAIRTGAVDSHGKSALELNLELLAYTRDHLDSLKTNKLVLVIDHTRNLLKEARRYRRNLQHELAVLLYATWAEHWLNSILQTVCQQRELSSDTCEQIIRDASFRAKTTWVLQLCGLPPLADRDANLLTELQNLRNGFVHYKYKSRSEDNLKQHDEQMKSAVTAAERLVRSLTAYENKHFFKQSRTRVQRMARQIGARDASSTLAQADELSQPDAKNPPTQPQD